MALKLSYQTSGDETPAQSNWDVFKRLLRLLRPYRGRIIFALILLILSTPGDLFPAMVWGFVTDDVALQGHGFFLPLVHGLISCGGHIQGRFPLLIASVVWLLIVYLLAETLGTLESWMLNR